MQRGIKRAVVAIAAVGAMALVAGCSNNPTGSGDQVLTVLSNSDFKPAFEELIADFEAANDGVTVQVTYASGNDYDSIVGTAISSGNAPDIIDALPGASGASSTQEMIDKGVLLDLSDQDWASEVPQSINAQNQPGRDDDTVYAYPVLVQPMGAFYNLGTLDETGLEPPATWSDLLQFCADAQDAGKVAYSLGIADQWIGQLIPYALADTLVYGDDPNWGGDGALSAGEVSLTDSAWVEVFQKYNEMGESGCFNENPNAIGLDATFAPVSTGEALGIVQVGATFGNLQGLDESQEYTLSALPANDDPESTYMPASPAHEYGVYADSEKRELALSFLDFFAQSENINKFVETIGGAVPAIPNDAFVPPALLEEFNEYVTNDRVRAFPSFPNVEVQTAVLVETQNMFLGSVTPEQLVERMQAAVK
jgi:raffinose/stachyose/melibiose transport system substrate-binding protein